MDFNTENIRSGWIFILRAVLNDIKNKKLQDDFRSKMATSIYIRSIERCLMSCLETKGRSFHSPLFSPISRNGGDFNALRIGLSEIEESLQTEQFNENVIDFSNYIKRTLFYVEKVVVSMPANICPDYSPLKSRKS